MRPMIRTAMKNTTSISKQKFKESVKESKDSNKNGKGKSSGNEEDEEDEDPLAALSVEAKRSLAGLLGVQVKQLELQNQFKREVWELEKKVSAYIFGVLFPLNLY